MKPAKPSRVEYVSIAAPDGSELGLTSARRWEEQPTAHQSRSTGCPMTVVARFFASSWDEAVLMHKALHGLTAPVEAEAQMDKDFERQVLAQLRLRVADIATEHRRNGNPRWADEIERRATVLFDRVKQPSEPAGMREDVRGMSDSEIVAELDDLEEQFKDRGEGGGSSGEWIVERMSELETEQRRRGGS